MPANEVEGAQRAGMGGLMKPVPADVLEESFSIPETVITKWLAQHQDD